MAKKKTASRSATVTKSAPDKKGRVGRIAGKTYDMTPPEFEKVDMEDVQFKTYTRETSKYKELVEAAIDLEDGECITVKVNPGEDPKKKRLSIGQVIMNKARPQIEKGYKLRVKLNADDTKVVIYCKYVGEESEKAEE